MERKYDDILSLLHSERSTQEDATTEELIKKLKHVWTRGYFNHHEFLAMCKWKDRRELRRQDWLKNTEDELRKFSTRSISAADEARRMLYLCRLKGVGVPIASAILTLTNPEQYGVIDIRVWQVLFLYGEVDYDQAGTALDLLHWLDYLDKVRVWAGVLDVSVRTVERTLFEHHRKIQTKTLYA